MLASEREGVNGETARVVIEAIHQRIAANKPLDTAFVDSISAADVSPALVRARHRAGGGGDAAPRPGTLGRRRPARRPSRHRPRGQAARRSTDEIDSGRLRLRMATSSSPTRTDKLVFGGDLTDRGPDSIWLRQELTRLKEHTRSRRAGLGQPRPQQARDGLARGRARREPDRQYRDWLSERGIAPDDASLADRVEHWLDRKSARAALEHHRVELESREGRPVSRDEAAARLPRAAPARR
jgi:hypothetical protein